MKKVVSIVLVLSLVLGSFGMAFANPTGMDDIDGIEKQGVIELLYWMTIVNGKDDGTYSPTEKLNRAQFSQLMSNTLQVSEDELATYKSTKFKDTAGYGWAVPVLAYCESAKLMIGDGKGNAMPGRTISANEAYTMTVRLLGVNENASVIKNSSYPANYVSLAKSWGLTKDVEGTTIDRANAAQIIYNALYAQMWITHEDGRTEHADNAGLPENLFETFGVNYNLAREVLVTSDMVAGAKNFPELENYLNQYVTVFYAPPTLGNPPQQNSDILYAAPVDPTYDLTTLEGGFYANKAGTIAATDQATAKFFITDDGDVYTFGSVAGTAGVGTVLATNPEFTVNGEATANLDVLILNQTSIELNAIISEDSDVVIESVVTVADWQVNEYVLLSADVKDTDATIGGEDLPMNAVTGKVNESAFKVDGAVSKYTDIKAGDVVSIFVGPTSGEVTKLSVCQDTKTGKVTRVTPNTSVTLDGTLYEFAAGVNSKTVVANDFGLNVTIKLTADGKYISYEYPAAANRQYAVVTEARAAGADLKVVNQAGEAKTYLAADFATRVAGDDALVAGDVIMYDVAADDAKSVTAIIPQTVVPMNGSYVDSTFDGKSFASNAVVLFNLDEASGVASVDYAASTASRLVGGQNYDVNYVLNGDKIAFAYTSFKNSMDTKDGIAVFNDFNVAQDWADGYFDGKAVTFDSLMGAAAANLVGDDAVYNVYVYNGTTLVEATKAIAGDAAETLTGVLDSADNYTFKQGGTSVAFQANGYIYYYNDAVIGQEAWEVLTADDITTTFPGAGIEMLFFGDRTPYGVAVINGDF